MKAANYSNNEIVNLTEYLVPKRRFLDPIIDEIYQKTPLNTFKAAFSEVARTSGNNATVSKSLMKHTQTAFHTVLAYVNHMLYHSKRFTDDQRNEIGHWMHQEFIAFCLLGTWPSRSLAKPQHIAGDHHTIKQIYRNGDQEKRHVGHVVNYCFLQEPACKAVKNRKAYIKKRILDKISKHDDPLLITSVASGPAEEIFEVFDQLGKDNRRALKAVGLDIDKRACAAVDDRIYVERLKHYFSTHATNILKLKPIPSYLQQQDLVYSMGLIDYFKDRATIKILNVIYQMLKPGGEIIIGNFHDSCESRIFLDYLLDWKLIYRTEADMHRLFEQSHFRGCKVTVDFEEEGVNMLARCTKR